MTNAKPEKKVISKLNSNAVNAGDIKFNQAIDDCMAYTDDLLRPLEEIEEKYKPIMEHPGIIVNAYHLDCWNAIQSVLAKHKGTGEGET